MSTRQWEQFFGTMGWSGPGFGQGVYTDGHTDTLRAAGLADQLQYLTEGNMRSDDFLCSVFQGGAAIQRTGLRPVVDITSLPRCYIYSGSVSEEGITLAQITDVDLFIEVVFSVSSVQVPTPGGATLASIMEYIAWFVLQSQEMPVLLTQGQSEKNLCETVTVRPFGTLENVDPKSGRVAAYSQVLQVRYNTLADYRTGRFLAFTTG